MTNPYFAVVIVVKSSSYCNLVILLIALYFHKITDMPHTFIYFGDCSIILYLEGNLESKVFTDPITGLVRRIREIAIRRNGMCSSVLFSLMVVWLQFTDVTGI